jgi:hypothetical protein
MKFHPPPRLQALMVSFLLSLALLSPSRAGAPADGPAVVGLDHVLSQQETTMAFFPCTTLSTILAVLVYLVLSANVGRARKTYGIVAPAVTGHIEFEKRYRVQMNTVEQLIPLLPLLWLCAVWVGDDVAAAMGLLWSIGRILYARGYYAAPEKRGVGFGIGAVATIGMLLAILYAVVKFFI